MPDFESVLATGLKAIADQHKVKDPQAAGVVADRVPSTGTLIYRVSAVAKDQPNGPIYSVVVDEKGGQIDAAALARSEKVEMFPAFARKGAEDVNPAVKTETFRDGGAVLPVPSVPVTISPNVNDLHLSPGEVFEEDIHVTTPAVPPPPVDVYFLADTTGSMSGPIGAVQTGANTIMTQINASVGNVAYAAGNYKDFANGDPYCFQHQQNATLNTATVSAAINAWSASGGGDGPEGQLYALYEIAQNAATFFRPGAKRILVWFGDAPGHDPICAGMGTPPLGSALTASAVKAALAGANIIVLAISTNTGYPLGLNDVPTQGAYPCANTGAGGQGTLFAGATPGGSYTSGVNAATISATIVAMVTAAANLFNNINLVPAGATAPFVTSITPAGGYGPVSGSTAHDYVFHVKFTGPPCTTTDQVFTGTLDVVADGHVVAQKKVTLTVLACERWSYGVKFLCGYVKETPPGVVPLTPVATLRPGSYATEVNILNYHKLPVTVHKYLYTLMHQTEPIGREPRYVGRRGEDAVTLPPKSATFDDCFHLHEMLHEVPGDEPLSIYYLEIVSPVELTVTAVYTANDLRGISVSLEVLQIEGKQLDK